MEGFQKKLVEGDMIEYSLAEVLRIFSFGSEMRQALERIAKSHRGALIVLSEKARDIAEGGFNINSKFTSQKMAELAKMDGAIITDSKLRKILYANALLVPDSRIKSKGIYSRPSWCYVRAGIKSYLRYEYRWERRLDSFPTAK